MAHAARMLGCTLPAIALLAGQSAWPVAETAPPPESMAATRAADLRPSIEVLRDRALFLTPGGLYRLHLESESWTLTTEREGLPDPPLAAMTLAGEELWLSAAGGAGVSDLRYDDWRRYGRNEGLPARAVADIESDADYAYAATDSGAARLDLYVLEWERLLGPGGAALGPAADVAVDEERVWFALAEGVAEFRKGPESMHLHPRLGALDRAPVLALRQTARYLWAITTAGLARYDKGLETWTSYIPGGELPDARLRQFILQGDDLWLATSAGLWRYLSEAGIWRRHEAADLMPGTEVRALALEQGRVWVATERAFAVYEESEGRWVEFTASVPMAPGDCRRMARAGGALLLLSDEEIVYGLSSGESQPSRFTWRTIPIEQRAAAVDAARWRASLDAGGLGLTAPGGETVTLKGGATIYVEEETAPAEGLGDLGAETRIDAALSARLRGDRSASAFYDNTDPDNVAYQASYRGARDDLLRSFNAGEIEQQLFNTQLAPVTGLRGAGLRAELGGRSEATHRRLVTADGWVGGRRTFPGRDVFRGNSREVQGELPDGAYARRQVFALPAAWRGLDPDRIRLYRDDDRFDSDDANTFQGELAGLSGHWDRLVPLEAWTLTSGADAVILTTPLPATGRLVAVAGESALPAEVDLGAHELRNHYWLALEPIPGSLEVTIADTTGAEQGSDGRTHLDRFGLDADRDGRVDAERFSPLTGFLAFPDSLPFPQEVYADPPQSLYRIAFRYRSQRTLFQLSHRNLVPGSERIVVDRERLQPGTDYTLLPTTGILVLFEHVLLDEDSVIEAGYAFEATEDEDRPALAGGQLGVAPGDHLFLGGSLTHWEDGDGDALLNAGFNARSEWRTDESFLRFSPEIAFSRRDSQESDRGHAAAAALQARHAGLELAGTWRDLGAEFVSMEDRRTLLGRLREESSLDARYDFGRRLQATVEWNQARSDSVAPSALGGSAAADSAGLLDHGTERALLGGLRFLNSGLPNIALTRGLVTAETSAGRTEKWITRAEVEIDPSVEKLGRLGLQRLWVRSFFQRSDRRRETAGAASERRRTTDHAYLRVNGSHGNPVAWNLVFEDRRTDRPAGSGAAQQDLHHYQRADGTLQLRPHPVLDSFLRGRADRARTWDESGAPQGYDSGRLFQTTTQLYPGRLAARLTPLSLRIDLSAGSDQRGEPGEEPPGWESLVEGAPDAPKRVETLSSVLESRLQLAAWLRWVSRWERDDREDRREELGAEVESRALENRLELRPSGGLLILRLRGEEESSGIWSRRELRRFLGDWDQTWGRGWLTYASLELSRTDDDEGLIGERTDLISPRARVTLRRSFMNLEASLGLALTLSEIEETPSGAERDSRSLALTSSWTLQPHPILSFKVQAGTTRSLPEGAGDRTWSTEHDAKLRVTVRL